MPTSLIIRLKGEKEQRHGPYMASMMQGVLMEKIDPAYAELLHATGAHPYSQYVQVKEDDTIYWTINAMSGEAERNIIAPLLKNEDRSIFLSHRDETLEIIDKRTESISYDELVQKYYLGTNDRALTLQFLTPTSFKQNGRYCIFPTSRLIFQSLMMRYDAGAEESSIFSEEMVEEFEEYAEITDYRLRSVRFSMEGVKIPSFAGECTIRIRGPQQLVNVAHMLAQFGQYSGVGIKTGLGMGALRVENNSIKGKGKRANPVKHNTVSMSDERGMIRDGRSAE